MTSLRYSGTDCAEKSQVRGIAPSSNAWNVNLHNGNANINNQNNSGRVLACRAVSECQDGVTFRQLFDAWQQARKQKVPSENQLQFESNWIDELLTLERQINLGIWSPKPTTCFIASHPKAREIHAPDFGDRVVHHWLVPQLEAIWEPRFIHHSYANRKGKGSHAAVDALQRQVRQVASGQGGGWYLQLDVRNFFIGFRGSSKCVSPVISATASKGEPSTWRSTRGNDHCSASRSADLASERAQDCLGRFDRRARQVHSCARPAAERLRGRDRR